MGRIGIIGHFQYYVGRYDNNAGLPGIPHIFGGEMADFKIPLNKQCGRPVARPHYQIIEI